MKVAIYCRVSPTKKEKDEFIAKSITDQITICKKQAEVDGYEVYKEYVDQYKSGSAQKYMLSFQDMIKDAKDKKFQKIYCRRVDRFGRNLSQLIITQKELQEIDIHIKFVEQGIDTSKTFGRMIMGVMASVAEWQRETILTNTRIGREIAYKKNPEKFGRPRKDIDWNKVSALLKHKEGDIYTWSWSRIAKDLRVTTATLLRRYRKDVGEVVARRI